MTTYGVTATGFIIKDLDTIKTEIETALKASLGSSINLLSTSVLGQMVGIFAERESELWELSQSVYNAQYPDTASGQSLDNILAYTGITRLPTTKSTVVLTCNLNNGVTIPIGKIVSVTGQPDVRFVTTQSITNSTGAPANMSQTAECSVTGPIVAVSGTLTVIDTPITGWNSVTNALDAEVGRDVETDAAARLRREDLLRATGSSAADAIRSKLLLIDNVTSAYVFENVTDVADVDGVPPHAIEAVVQGGLAADIEQCIFDNLAAGIQAHGDTVGTVVDTQGFNHSIGFTDPVDVLIYVAVSLTKDANYPSDGDTQVKQAIVDFGLTLGIADDVIFTKLYEAIYSISGVVVVTALTLDTVSPPVAVVDIPINTRQASSWDTAQITVTTT